MKPINAFARALNAQMPEHWQRGTRFTPKGIASLARASGLVLDLGYEVPARGPRPEPALGDEWCILCHRKIKNVVWVGLDTLGTTCYRKYAKENE